MQVASASTNAHMLAFYIAWIGKFNLLCWCWSRLWTRLFWYKIWGWRVWL